MFDIPDWPYSYGKPTARGQIRTAAEDFIVEEVARVAPQGEGSHLWLWVEKQNANTDWVASQLAKAASCARRDVGYAGLKDRHAVTRQWFSLPAGDLSLELITGANIEGVKILDSRLHTRKLKRGTLDGNRFDLVIRDFNGEVTQTGQRLAKIKSNGVPNYFGPQRFGRNGLNVERGYKLLSNNARLPRNKRSIYLSSIRSFLFNEVLAERVRNGSWNNIMDGELVMLNGTHSIFECERVDADIEDRCKRLDIHPTGPLPGEDGSVPSAGAAVFERAVLQNFQELTEVLNAQRVRSGRRALRLYPADLQWKFTEGDLRLSFELPAGAYATTVLREIMVAVDAANMTHQA